VFLVISAGLLAYNANFRDKHGSEFTKWFSDRLVAAVVSNLRSCCLLHLHIARFKIKTKQYKTVLKLASYSLLAEVSHGDRKMNGRSAEIQRVSCRACSSVSLTTSDILVTCDTTLANRFARERVAAAAVRCAWHTELAPAVLAAVKTEFSYVIIRHHNIGYIPIWIK